MSKRKLCSKSELNVKTRKNDKVIVEFTAKFTMKKLTVGVNSRA